ncbi:transformation/transcription domain-associated protein isoform X2 [Tanacetum coccineum]
MSTGITFMESQKGLAFVAAEYENGDDEPTSTLSDLTERLKHWKNILQSNVEDRFPVVLKLEEESRVMRNFHVVEVEVPGQYFTDQEVAPDHTIKLDRIGADIPIARRYESSYRRLILIGSDRSQHHFPFLICLVLGQFCSFMLCDLDFEPLSLSLSSMPSCDLVSLANILILCLILKASNQS